MAYESRIYIVEVTRKTDKQKQMFGENEYAEKIAIFNLCCMGYDNGWRELFTKPVDFQLFAENGDDPLTKDLYGEPLKYADFDTVIRWLEAGGESDYRRTAPFLALLKGFERSKWQDLCVVHFGC